MKKTIGIGIAIFLACLVLIPTASATWCDANYGKKAPILINNTDGSAQTYYQVELNYTYDSDMNSNFSDIRVYNESDCSLIPLWNESAVASSWNQIWFNATNIPTSSWCNDTYSLYYSYSSANSVSDGDNTFELFDNFSGVFYYEKTDLDNFTKIGLYEGSNPVIACGGASDSDKYIREIGNVLYEPANATRKYKTFYTGYNTGSDYYIHYTYSEDGKSWTKYGKIISGHQIEDPYVVKNGSTYYLYAEEKEGIYANKRIRRYNSTDCETWNDEGTITTTDNTDNCQSPIVWIEDSTWYMIYERYPNHADIALATSSDGLTWIDNASNPVMIPSDTNWATGVVVPDDIVKKGSTYHMLYHGYDGTHFQTGKANSTDLINWTDYSESPIHSDYTDETNIPTTMIFYDTEDVFLSYINDGTIGDTSGIYRGYPIKADDIVLDSSKWTIEKKGSTDAIVELDGSGNLHLAGKPNVDSNGNVKSLTTFTNSFLIKVKRKWSSERYVEVSIGNGVIQDIGGAQTDWWHACQGNGYWLGQTTLINRYLFRTPSGAVGVQLHEETSSFGAINTWENVEFIYDSAGNLKWLHNGVEKFSATDTNYSSDEKHLLLTQGEYSTGLGGDSYYDWVLVRKYASPEPTAQLGTEESPPPTYIPPNPTNLQNTTGNFWVNYTWDAGDGNVTNSYNVSNQTEWFNGTTNTYYNESVEPSEWVNITVYAFNSSGDGTLSAGSVSDQVQTPAADTTFTVSLPVGYTKPVFQPPNSTATNYPPNGQTDSQEFYNVTNTGNVNLNVRMQLNATVSTITLKADADNNPTGADTIGTSLVTVYPNLGQGTSADIWLWSDFDHTPAQTINKTIYINVSES